MLTIEERAFRRAFNDEIKRVLTENGGSVALSASLLGVPHRRLSRVLNGRALGPWWQKFKRDKKKANKRLRNERWLARREARYLNGDIG